ncbi:MAG: hypothetical protein M4D80_36480 [Myxococcota bacterium]|nr:hypothetical protein [Deltaproteobacteria bacterium]MDQ3340688.1 hypothetical protein [Myxococcota bacterium]
MRWLVAVILVVGCGEKKEAPKLTKDETTSHGAMPNQFEVGSTINGRYLVTKKLGDVGQLDVFAVERLAQKDRQLTMVAPKTPATSMQLRNAVMIEMNDKKDFPWLDLDVTPDNRSYFAIGDLTDAQVKEILVGAHVLVK